jgi:hypothetical protein
MDWHTKFPTPHANGRTGVVIRSSHLGGSAGGSRPSFERFAGGRDLARRFHGGDVDFSVATRGAMIGVTRDVVTDLTGGGPKIVQVRRV